MNMLACDRVLPMIPASVSWLTFVITRSGFPSLPKFAISRSVLARRFSLELDVDAFNMDLIVAALTVPIRPFLSGEAFEPETIHEMSLALESVCKTRS
jgi:hypothetical protein